MRKFKQDFRLNKKANSLSLFSNYLIFCQLFALLVPVNTIQPMRRISTLKFRFAGAKWWACHRFNSLRTWRPTMVFLKQHLLKVHSRSLLHKTFRYIDFSATDVILFRFARMEPKSGSAWYKYLTLVKHLLTLSSLHFIDYFMCQTLMFVPKQKLGPLKIDSQTFNAESKLLNCCFTVKKAEEGASS